MAFSNFPLLIPIFIFCILTSLGRPAPTPPRQHPDLLPHHRELNESRRKLGYLSCGTGNPIDDCWRCDHNWQQNRQKLATCGVGFGKYAMGGYGGNYYMVTDDADDPVNPQRGSLRYGAIQTEPLWIVFSRDMTIHLAQELMVNSFKTIDGRGFEVVVTGNSGITLQFVRHIIITGLQIHSMRSAGNAMVRDSPSHFGWRTASDGDGIGLFSATDIWIDHCTLSQCQDGLIDIIEGSKRVTVSNCRFHDHDKVMLLGASDSYTPDDDMKVTITLNHFGENLIERMPRGRRGFAHVANNHYPNGWGMYAVGGGEKFKILSEGNVYVAPANERAKEVTHAEDESYMNWLSNGDQMLNGAYFTPMGSRSLETYEKASTLSLSVKDSSEVAVITQYAGTW